MSLVQRFAAAVLPATAFASLRAESQAWITTCPHCGHERSAWDQGGIRWKASGTPSRRLTCTACGKAGWHRLTSRQRQSGG